MRIFFYVAICFAVTGCVKEVKLNIRNPKPKLVVEGLLLADSTPCKVILSYSGAFNSNGAQLQDFIDDATVYLKEVETNDSIELSNQGSGIYLETDGKIMGKRGNSYSITIKLADGNTYASSPEKIQNSPVGFEIDSIGVARPYRLDNLYGANIQIRTQDPADETNYYRWIASSYIPRKAKGVPCGFQCIRDEYCWQYYENPFINVTSDNNINGQLIRYQTVLVSPYFWSGRHYVEIKQLSLTKSAYQFWKLYGEQTSRTGSILDPLPAQVTGNIYNVNNPNDLALGYFQASDAVSRKFIIAPQFDASYITFQYINDYIKDGACYEVYPHAIKYEPDGWENAPEYLVHVY